MTLRRSNPALKVQSYEAALLASTDSDERPTPGADIDKLGAIDGRRIAHSCSPSDFGEEAERKALRL